MELRLAILGDSIGYGIGASARADTLASRLAARLRDNGFAASAEVYAVPGARSAGLAAQVRRALAAPPDVAVIVIGANDLSHFVPAAAAADALRQAVRALGSAGAQVVVAPAPDLSIVPHVPPAFRATVGRASEQLRQAQRAATLAEGGRVADPDGHTSRAFAADGALFSADRFHPSSKGYAVIAEALLPAVRAAAAERRLAAS